MEDIVYVDVLLITNIYINYALLYLTSFIGKYPFNRVKVIISAFIGGLYSLIILIPGINEYIISASRIPALLVLVLVAFGYKNYRLLIKEMFHFLAVNFIFAGLMFVLWYTFSPDNMYYNNGIVYFNIDASLLVVMTISCYVIIKLFSLLLKNKTPQDCIYNLEIHIYGKVVSCRGLHDTGNSLTDPFSGEGVIIVSYDILKDLVPEGVFNCYDEVLFSSKVRYIPYEGISGEALMPIICADKVIIKSYLKELQLKQVIIGISNRKIRNGEFGALLYSNIFENINKNKGELCV